MSRLPIQTLPAFTAVARLQNLRAAAEQLHLTHSAISQQIKLLEQQLGFDLFDRRGRRLVLNAAGAALQRAVEPALQQLDEGVRSAAAVASGAATQLRITLLPSFAQRWLLPRMGRWRARHPDIGIELHTSQNTVDLHREGFHAALRQGAGRWRGLEAEPLTDSMLIAVGAPAAARRLHGKSINDFCEEPLLGDADLWERWLSQGQCRTAVRPVATFNDAGLMLQAAEQDIGIALARELLAADALREGRLVKLSDLAMRDEQAYSYWLAYPPELKAWAPIVALRDWLRDELALSIQGLAAPPATPPATLPKPAAKRAAASRSGSRSRAASG